MDTLAAAAAAPISEFRTAGLTNIAWAYATLAYLVRPLMEAISAEAVSRVEQFATRDIANIAFAFATLRVLHAPLMSALSAAALRQLHRVEPQSLAFLTEVGLDASTHPVLVQQLERVVEHLLVGLPKTLEQWRRGPDLRSLKEVRVDHLGSVGTRLLLDRAKIPAPSAEFEVRAVAIFPRGPSGDFAQRWDNGSILADNIPQQRRIFAYAEYTFTAVGRGSILEPLRGRMLRAHGFQGLRMWQKGWLRATVLPVNPHVDRSVCAEF